MEIHKFQIAKIQLDDAMLCFIEERYFSSLTLAGASEEIFGRLSERYCNKKSSYNNLKNLLKIRLPKESLNLDLNLSRNALKHATNPDEDVINIYPEVESMIMILRAINNYLNFSDSGQHKLPHIDTFLEKISSHKLVTDPKLKFHFL
ncbi:hypothetical protein A1OW_15845 [Enterovibrio norvegicus]|uniref:hypothetical protein n=1 Tax=Enterovibrio norvegicus TaxID=188144 RepID=UPI00036A4DFC|nr:hypothetical protein [Enterovibrio norvegicus]OEF48248.1 hypothetical protein A1OW_15845 [Enterovibrio norvegicus]